MASLPYDRLPVKKQAFPLAFFFSLTVRGLLGRTDEEGCGH